MADPTSTEIAAIAAKSGDTVEHITSMLNLANNVGNAPAAPVTEPALLAGKYKTPEDLNTGLASLVEKYGAEKAYKILESSMGKQDAPTEAPPEPKGDDGKTNMPEPDKDALSTEPPVEEAKRPDPLNDMPDVAKEYLENGVLSDESYEKIAKAGYDRNYVDLFLEGMSAKLTLWERDVHDMAGGKENYGQLLEWAKSNLTPAEIKKFNANLDSFDADSTKGMLTALKARYEKAEGTMGRKRLEPSSTHDNNSADGYNSIAEMQADMRDPRYKSGDKAFLKLVQAKMSKSSI